MLDQPRIGDDQRTPHAARRQFAGQGINRAEIEIHRRETCYDRHIILFIGWKIPNGWAIHLITLINAI